MLMHGYIDPPEMVDGIQMVAVHPDGYMRIEDMTQIAGVANGYVVSANYTLGALGTDNLVLVMGSEKEYDAIVTARSNALVSVEFCEWYGPWTGGDEAHIRAFDRANAAELEAAVDFEAWSSTVDGVGQTVLALDADTMIGCVLGMGAASGAGAAQMWRLATGTEYAIEVQDLGGVGAIVNITVILYER